VDTEGQLCAVSFDKEKVHFYCDPCVLWPSHHQVSLSLWCNGGTETRQTEKVSLVLTFNNSDSCICLLFFNL
jgi:hypothetical protein